MVVQVTLGRVNFKSSFQDGAHQLSSSRFTVGAADGDDGYVKRVAVSPR